MNGLIVQKYGGSSLATIDDIRLVAQKIVERKKEGANLVIVVSAMGNKTDELLKKVYSITSKPSRRELDMLLATGEQESMSLLAIAIHSLNEDAISLTGWHSEIITDENHSRARIKEIRGDRIREELEKGKIVIIAGFQGISEKDEEITIGGSDTTAVAVAVALEADICELIKQVNGIYTADPKLVPEAKLLRYINYDEILEMASSGAKVVQGRAVEIAKKFGMPICVRSYSSDFPGTIIGKEESMEGAITTGVACDKNIAKISLLSPSKEPEAMARTFQAIARHGINIKLIVESPIGGGMRAISFIVASEFADQCLEILEVISDELGEQVISCDKDVAQVSIVGSGIASHSGVAARAFSSLTKQGIDIDMVSTSEIKISCIIEKKYAEKAVRLLTEEFELVEK